MCLVPEQAEQVGQVGGDRSGTMNGRLESVPGTTDPYYFRLEREA